MYHHNKSVYDTHVMEFMFRTLFSKQRYLQDMLKTSDTRHNRYSCHRKRKNTVASP